MKPTLQTLLQRPDIWRAKSGVAAARAAVPSGLPTLDHALGGGWPAGALVELLLEQAGSGELRLLLPLLRPGAAGGQHPSRLVWIDPPLPPYAPALQQHGIALADLLVVRPADRAQWLWSCIQALRVGRDVAVLCWPNQHRLRYAELRQLQVAASEHGSLGFLVQDLARNRQLAQHSSPAPLRLQLTPGPAALQIDILKQRGGSAGQRIVMPHADALQPLHKRSHAAPATRRAALPLSTPPPRPEVRA
jgi:cell division inhibitor SulA/protein ImuA